MVRMRTNRVFVSQVFESGQVKLDSEVYAVSWGVLCVLAELVKCLNRSEGVLTSDVSVLNLG